MSLDVSLIDGGECVFDANITHNLNAMAKAADIYMYLWRPDELGITKASEIVGPLAVGLAKMYANPAKFREYNAKNGWGLYEHFVPWIENYLLACIKNPNATIKVSR